ncbi:MAG TPA: hypothetical protein VH496_05495 [Mycobacterium sp.]|jgi:hypothetical protein
MPDTTSAAVRAVTEGTGACSTVAAGAVKEIAAVSAVLIVAVGAPDGVVEAGSCTARATTLLASTVLAGTGSEAGADAEADPPVLLPDAVPRLDTGGGCCQVAGAAVSVVVAPTSAGPVTLSGAPVVPGVAVVLACAVAAIESGSDPATVVVAAVPAEGEEPVGELVCAPPVPTTTPDGAQRVAGGEAEDVAPAGAAVAGDDVRAPPELLAATWPGVFIGIR